MKKLTLASVALVASIAAGGCADTIAPDEFNSEIDADVAVVAADAAVADVVVMTSQMGFGPQSAPGLGRFGSGPLAGGNAFGFARAVTYYDASGAVQDAYDELTTA